MISAAIYLCLHLMEPVSTVTRHLGSNLKGATAHDKRNYLEEAVAVQPRVLTGLRGLSKLRDQQLISKQISGRDRWGTPVSI